MSSASDTQGVVLRHGVSAVRVQVFGEDEPVTVRGEPFEIVVPGEIVTVQITKRWRYRGHAYATGAVHSPRLDVSALSLTPLPVRTHGRWKPVRAASDDVFGVDAGVMAMLPRQALPDCEMSQVIPGEDEEDAFGDSDPAIVAMDLARGGDFDRAWSTLDKAVAADLRYLDGHAHMGNLTLREARTESALRTALRHYTVGVAIGRSFLPEGFNGYLRSARLDNRPFLRCLHGRAITLGKLGDLAGAEATLRESLRFDPEDRPGARFLLNDVARGDTAAWVWEDA